MAFKNIKLLNSKKKLIKFNRQWDQVSITITIIFSAHDRVVKHELNKSLNIIRSEPTCPVARIALQLEDMHYFGPHKDFFPAKLYPYMFS